MSTSPGVRLIRTLLLAALVVGCGGSAPSTRETHPVPLLSGPRRVVQSRPESVRTAPGVSAVHSLPGMAPVASEQLVQVEAVSKNGAWVVYCQLGGAPGGTTVQQRLPELLVAVVGSEPAPVEAFVAADPTERWLLVSRQGMPELWDTRSGARSRLEALTEASGALGWPAHARSMLAFDARGERLFFMRSLASGGYDVLSVRLADGAETQLVAGQGTPRSLRVGPRGRFLIVDEVGPGRSGEGVEFSFRDPAPCSGPTESIVVQPVPAHGRSRLLSLVDGSSVVVEDLAAPFGEGYLFRDPRGRLVRSHRGKRTTLASSKCGARVLDSSPEHQLALIGCAQHRREKPRRKGRRQAPSPPLTRWPLRLVGSGLDRDLELTIGPIGHDLWPRPAGTSLAFVHAGAQTVVLDYESRKVVELGPGDLVVQVHERRALVLSGQTLRVLELPGAEVVVAQPGVQTTPQILSAGSLAFVSPFVVDLARPAVLGRVDAFALGLARDARVLVAKGRDPEPDRWARGPLRWVKPSRLPTRRRP